MAAPRNRSPWPRRILIGITLLLAVDAALLAAAAGVPGVRQGARRFRPTLGALLTAATSQSVAWFAPARAHREAHSSAAAPRAPRALRMLAGRAPLAPAAPAGFSFALCASEPEDDFRYLYAVPSEGSHGWEMSGAFDQRRLATLRLERRPFVWFSGEDGEYLVTDGTILRQAERITRPVREQGAEMGRIGAQQGRIGARQGAIGARIGALAAEQAAAAVAGDDGRADQLDAQMERMRRQLERESAAFEAQMQPLAREQERLGRIQSELGRRQEALVQVERRAMRELLGQAKRDGKAVRLHVEA